MTRADPIFKLRLPDFMREKLETEATLNRRSLTAEILSRLEESLSDTAARMAALEREVFDANRGNEALSKRLLEISANILR